MLNCLNNIGNYSEIKILVVVFNVDNDDNRQCPAHPLIINYSELVNAIYVVLCGLMCYLCIFTTFAAGVIIFDIYFTFLL